MNSGIFLIQPDESLVQMTECQYDSEDLLQGLLAKYPSLLAGDQIESDAPRRWLLIRREMSIPAEQDGGGRWSVDHLFLDQDAIPTLVEVKRSTDTRIRREVVGQMLDYAANAVVYWPVEQLRSQFERHCESNGVEAERVLTEFLGEGGDIEAFWQLAKTNLQAGRIRMVFVADVIPAELRRIVEFLNGQMDPAQVLAVEIKQYIGKGLRSLVPRLIGQTAEAEKKKSAGGREQRKWDEQSLFDDIAARRGTQIAATARKLFDWASTKTDRFYWGKGVKNGSVQPNLDNARGNQRLYTLFSNGTVQIPFGVMRSSLPFTDLTLRTELLRRLDEIDGVDFPPEAINNWPTFDIALLSNELALKQFVGAMEWAVEQIRAGV